MKECIGTTTTYVSVNGIPTDEFSLERRLRQGGPLSSFLFLLAAEGLHTMMTATVKSNIFIGYRVGTHPPDDTVLLGVKNLANVKVMCVVLVIFEVMTDLKVNFNKSLLIEININNS